MSTCGAGGAVAPRLARSTPIRAVRPEPRAAAFPSVVPLSGSGPSRQVSSLCPAHAALRGLGCCGTTTRAEHSQAVRATRAESGRLPSWSLCPAPALLARCGPSARPMSLCGAAGAVAPRPAQSTPSRAVRPGPADAVTLSGSRAVAEVEPGVARLGADALCGENAAEPGVVTSVGPRPASHSHEPSEPVLT